MRKCPHCHKKTIPLLHAYLTTKGSAPIVCSNCSEKINCVFDYSYSIAMLPIAVAGFIFTIWDVQPEDFVYFFILFSGLFGVSLGEHTIRYVVVDKQGVLAKT